uniref:RRM domain-containing protein n=1 Tax=Leersia perrieri TaxID=77586 RepID=A0A0D9WVM5_9ORYZ
MAAVAAAAAFRSLLHPAAGASERVPPPPTSHLRLQILHRQRVGGLHLFVSGHRRSRPILIQPIAAAGDSAGGEFSSDGEEYVDEDEDEQYEEEEGEEEEETAAAAPRGYYPPRSRPVAGQEPGRLFVGNLPYSLTAGELSQTFSEAGSVDNVQIIYDKVTDRSRGFAFVTMATAEEATKAIQMFDGALLGGRTARVNYPEVPRGRERTVGSPAATRGSRRDDGTFKIYAGNLGWGVRADSLRAAFEGQSGLLDARVIFERDTGRSRGFGFVSFRTAEEAQAALEALDGVELEGRPLRLSMAEQNPTAGSPSTVQSQQEETASESSDAETEEPFESETEESNLQAAGSY